MTPINEITKETISQSKALEMVGMITGIRCTFDRSNLRYWLNPEKGTISVHKSKGISFFKLKPIETGKAHNEYLPGPAAQQNDDIFDLYDKQFLYNQYYRTMEDAVLHFMAFWAKQNMYDPETGERANVVTTCTKCGKDHTL